MTIIVQKYGGSSVADIDKIKAVADKVVRTVRAGHEVVVVVSAMGNTTDDLLAMSRQINPEPERRELDMLLSVGERISMALLSMAIHVHGIGAVSFTGSQSGIITTASHAGARIIEVRPYRIQDELSAGKVVIVAGYQGVSYKREITTLGRGGSDTTAVALAAALGAEACEIYSDVDGVFTTDPRIVDDASRLESITYGEMQEMARLGAKVLNATAVEFARRAQIALFARSTHLQNSRGTRIHSGGDLRRVDDFADRCALAEQSLGVKAIAATREGLFVEAKGLDAGGLQGLCGALEAIPTPFFDLDATRGQLRALLTLDDVHDEGALASSLSDTHGAVARKGLGLVSAVGTGVGDRPKALAVALGAMNDAGIAVEAAQASGPSIRLLIASEAIDGAVQALHAALITPFEAP